MSDNDTLENFFSTFEDKIDAESDLQGVSLESIQDIVTGGSDWTVASIVDLLKRGTIELEPDFQRRFAWSKTKKSRFIESLYMSLPIPQIVLAESSKGKFIVIDGKQRLLTLKEFVIDNDLKLSNLEFLKDLNQKTHEDIKNDILLEDQQLSFETTTVRTVLIKNWAKDEKILHLMFLRLNTGSVPLSPQELRKALHPGDFLTYLDKYCSETELFSKYMNFKRPDYRMRDVELILRYLGFQYFSSSYTGNLKEFLDHVAKTFNANWKNKESQILGSLSKMEQAYHFTEEIFGENTFQKWNGEKYESRKNRAVVDIMTYYFSNEKTAKEAIEKAREVEAAFRALCEENDNFRSSLESSTKNIAQTKERFSTWGKTLDTLLTAKVSIPKIGG